MSHVGLLRLGELNRLATSENSDQLVWKRYESEMPGTKLNNVWDEKNAASDMHYVVETAEKVIERCLLMSTDPGDLVFRYHLWIRYDAIISGEMGTPMDCY